MPSVWEGLEINSINNFNILSLLLDYYPQIVVHRTVTERKIYINITTKIKLSKTKELPIKSDSQSFTVLSPMLSNGWNPISFGIERWKEPHCSINSSISKEELNFRLFLDLISNRRHVVTIDIGYFLTFPSLWHVC